MPTVFQDDVIERGFTMAELYAMSEEDRQRYKDELKHYRDVLNMLRAAREEGIEQGNRRGPAGRPAGRVAGSPESPDESRHPRRPGQALIGIGITGTVVSGYRHPLIE